VTIPHEQIAKRREAWYTRVRERIHEVFNEDGSGVLPQFNPPWREPLWILPALYTGGPEHVALANRVVARYNTTGRVKYAGVGEVRGKQFGIFQSNILADFLHQFHERLTPAAEKVMRWHAEQVFKTYRGAAQPDFKFHGANDNMPMMATFGLILGGEATGNRQAIRHGVWNLNQFRRLLSRSAWASEFNSSTYSALTLSGAARIATFSRDPAIRELALQVEERVWAELLLHYHPGTFQQAGPHSRAYSIDYAGHNHSLQLIYWLVFGAAPAGRDLLQSYFEPDGTEVIHFEGCYWQSIAEYCDFIATDFHVPAHLARLIRERRYPALLRGRCEIMGRYDGMSAVCHTETWMEPEYSLGTVNGPHCGGEQTSSLHVTYRRTPRPKTFRDSGTVFFKYQTDQTETGSKSVSADGKFKGEKFVSNRGWVYALQKENTALLLCTPNLTCGLSELDRLAGKPLRLRTDTLKLQLVFPAHYGSIRRSVIGAGPVRAGATGQSAAVEPVSIEAGEVHLHVQPLLPTSLPRNAAVLFVRQNQYEILELVNYEGRTRTFTRQALARVLNGMVVTVAPRRRFRSLQSFHARMSEARIVDYFMASHRFFVYQRPDVEFEVVLTTDPFGVQTESIDGRQAPRPDFESNQLDVSKLPFMCGPVERNVPFFPWPRMDICWYPYLSWIIGSRGLPGEENYAKRVEKLRR